MPFLHLMQFIWSPASESSVNTEKSLQQNQCEQNVIDQGHGCLRGLDDGKKDDHPGYGAEQRNKLEKNYQEEKGPGWQMQEPEGEKGGEQAIDIVQDEAKSTEGGHEFFFHMDSPFLISLSVEIAEFITVYLIVEVIIVPAYGIQSVHILLPCNGFICWVWIKIHIQDQESFLCGHSGIFSSIILCRRCCFIDVIGDTGTVFTAIIVTIVKSCVIAFRVAAIIAAFVSLVDTASTCGEKKGQGSGDKNKTQFFHMYTPILYCIT
nr:MAG TPA: hypothetical protein [Caudoviricetes sp.]